MDAETLARRTLELVDVPSESRGEDAIADLVRDIVPLPLFFDDDNTLLFRSDGDEPRLVLAGHLDTVPAQHNVPGRIANGAVHGLGASDMKGGLAVMVELARETHARAVDFVFFPREEISVEFSPLPLLFESGLLDGSALVVVLEPTDNEIHAGCLGNINARVRFEGVSAHSARPWQGVNAIQLAVEGLQELVALEPLDVEIDGLVFREVVTATRIEGGRAQNVVPDVVECELNYRYAPHRTLDDARRRLADLLEGLSWETLSEAAGAHVAVDNALVERMRASGVRVAPKQAWTPVAQFAERGFDAINFGPGATAYAHKQDEQVPIANLVRAFETLRPLLGA